MGSKILLWNEGHKQSHLTPCLGDVGRSCRAGYFYKGNLNVTLPQLIKEITSGFKAKGKIYTTLSSFIRAETVQTREELYTFVWAATTSADKSII